MTLKTFLKSLAFGERAAFAARCGTSFAYLQQIGYGNRTCTTTMAIHLERESGGTLRCEVLCPHADWAFIRSTGQSK